MKLQWKDVTDLVRVDRCQAVTNALSLVEFGAVKGSMIPTLPNSYRALLSCCFSELLSQQNKNGLKISVYSDSIVIRYGFFSSKNYILICPLYYLTLKKNPNLIFFFTCTNTCI